MMASARRLSHALNPARVVSLAFVIVTSGCASSGSTPVAARPNSETVRVSAGGTMGVGTSTLQDSHAGTVRAPMADVWRVLPAVLDSLGIPLTMRDPATSRLGNSGFTVRRVLGGTIVSRYFDCGESRGGPSALSLELFLTIVTQVRPDSAGGTEVMTAASVRGKPMTYSGDWLRCESTGLLEERIVDGVTKRLAR